MRSPRALAVVAASLLGVLLLATVLLPFLFRDRIAARLKAELDASLDAQITWRRASLSLLRSFPGVTLRLDDASIVGVAPFAGDTLIAAQEASVVLDLRSVVSHLRRGGRIVVRELRFVRPAARLLVLPDGRANWDILRERVGAASDTGSAMRVTLRHLRITRGSLSLDDQPSRLQLSVRGLDESMRGDFARQRFDLVTRTSADSVSLTFAGIPYLSRVAVQLDADVDADLVANRFTFADDTLRLNQLVIAFGGTVGTSGPDTELDVRFAAPGTAFREILSLVPAIYHRDFASLRTSGTMSLAGTVRGRYGEDAFPALSLTGRVENGAFQYASLPLPARGISMDLAIRNPGGHVDSTVIAVERFRATIGSRPLAARLMIRTPVGDPDVELALAGTLDLADLARTVKLADMSGMTGIVAADIATRARRSDVDARRFERVAARGAVHVSRLAMRPATLPRPVAVDTAALRLTPQAAELGLLVARVGGSDVRASGALDNLLGFALWDDDLRGRATVRSARLDVADWRSAEDTTGVVVLPSRVDLSIDLAAAHVVHGAIAANEVRGTVRVKNERATLNELRMQTMRGTAVASGYYDTRDAVRPAFDILLRVDTMDIPTTFATVVTVQKLAPIARWAQGRVSGTAWLRGPLDAQMAPVYDALNGEVAFVTADLSLRQAPVMTRVGDALSLEQLRNPSLGVVRGSFEVAAGRVTVKPFVVRMAGLDMTVSGSHGIDQTLRYDLGMAIPRALLGDATNAAVERLASRAGKRVAALAQGEVAQLSGQVTGTMAEPELSLRFDGVAASAREAIGSAVRQEVATRAEDVRQRADSALEEARRRARAERDSLVAAAERQAEVIRTEARALAERLLSDADARADSLVARTSNPAARIAARAAADRMRREADQQADRAIREADARATAVVERARREGAALEPPTTQLPE